MKDEQTAELHAAPETASIHDDDCANVSIMEMRRLMGFHPEFPVELQLAHEVDYRKIYQQIPVARSPLKMFGLKVYVDERLPKGVRARLIGNHGTILCEVLDDRELRTDVGEA